MQTILCLQNGRWQLGLILRVNRDSIRVAFPSRSDVVELRSANGQWVSDSGQRIEVEGMLLAGAASASLHQPLRVQAAGYSIE